MDGIRIQENHAPSTNWAMSEKEQKLFDEGAARSATARAASKKVRHNLVRCMSHHCLPHGTASILWCFCFNHGVCMLHRENFPPEDVQSAATHLVMPSSQHDACVEGWQWSYPYGWRGLKIHLYASHSIEILQAMSLGEWQIGRLCMDVVYA